MSPRAISRRDLFRYSGASLGALAAARVLGGTPAAAVPRTAVSAKAPALQLARVSARSDAQRRVLAHLDATHRTFADGSAEFLLWPGDEARLREIGVDYVITDADLLRGQRLGSDRAVLRQPGETANGEYRRLADYNNDLQALYDAYADTGRIRIFDAAVPSLHGYVVKGVEIATNVGHRDGRPYVIHDGLHHSREWPAGEMPLMWAYDLLESYGKTASEDPDAPSLTRIVDEVRTIVFPMVNPDGFVRSRESLVQASDGDLVGLVLAVGGKESQWRKNLRSLSDTYVQGVTETASEAHGIDLNRNYPAFWGDEDGSSSIPEDQTYRGTAPYSEPEAHNVATLVKAAIPVTHITHHTSGGHMLYPWGRNPALFTSPDIDYLEPLGAEMAVFNGYAPNQAFSGLYPTSGTSRDHSHDLVRSLVYTFEHGEVFHEEPYTAIIPDMYAINRGAFITHALAALDPSVHAQITGRVVDSAGNPVDGAVLHVRKEVLTPLDVSPEARQTTAAGVPDELPETIDRVVDLEADGSFRLVLPPSSRPHLNETRFGGPGNFEQVPAELKEPFHLVAELPDGSSAMLDVVVDRGDSADVGTIVVG
jgi:hypothetical protein